MFVCVFCGFRVCAASVSNRHPVIQQLLAGTPWYDQLDEMSELKAPPAPKKAPKVGHRRLHHQRANPTHQSANPPGGGLLG